MSKTIQYDDMKDSGFQWIGKIPHHWKTTRMKEIFQNITDKGHPDAEVLSLYREYGVLPKNSRDDNHNITSKDTGSYKYVQVGDLVINKMKAWQGSLGVSDYAGIVSPAYYVCHFRSENFNKKYFHYLLRCRAYAQEFERLSTGMRVGQWDLNIDDFMTVPAVVPLFEEQQAIASFLDDQCAQIDDIIAEAKASIEEQRHWRAAIIEEAGTRGLSIGVQKKKSQLEWIDDIPLTWGTARLKAMFSFGKGLPITKDNLVEAGVPVISYGQIHSKTNLGTTVTDDLIRFVPESYLTSNSDSLANRGDILMADTSEDLTGCGNCVYVDRDGTLFAGYHTIILRSTEERNNKYLSYLFKTDAWRSQIRTRVSGVKLFSISRKILGVLTVLIPPEDEQTEIVEYLDKKCMQIDSVIAEKEALITELEAYKRSLIYETVTGKRKVV